MPFLTFDKNVIKFSQSFIYVILCHRDISPKNENSVIIYSPSSCSIPVWVSFFCWTQNKIFWKMWATKWFLVPIDFNSTFSIQAMDHQLFGYPYSSKYIILYSTEIRNAYKLGATWGWVNDDNFYFIIPLTT